MLFKMVFHRDPLGIATFIGVHILLLFGDLVGVYVVIEYGRHEGTGRTLAALVLHVLYILAVTSHLRASFSNPGYVPQSGIKIDFSSDLEHKERKKRKKEPPPLDEWTVCTKCETYRPPRSHHCRICGRCVRRMDHHCPWINNCVGELNYKYFFLFIAYADILCSYGVALIIWDWITNWHTDQGTLDKTLTIIAFFEAVIFGVFVGGMLLAQMLSVLCNRSAIEIRRYGRPPGMPTTPKLALIAAVCGRGPKILWFFPCAKAHIPDPIPPSDKLHDINQFV